MVKDHASPLALGEADPLESKTKKLVIKEWKSVLEHDPKLFQKAWVGSANRSMSIKQIFGIPLNQDAGEVVSFSNLYTLIEDFFTKLIVTEQLEEENTMRCAQALGARHIDFVGKGFNSAFWEIFMVCLSEALHESMKTYYTEPDKSAELAYHFEKTFAWVLYNMRKGFSDRKKREGEEKILQRKITEIKSIDNGDMKKEKLSEPEDIEKPSRCRCS